MMGQLIFVLVVTFWSAVGFGVYRLLSRRNPS
jgi:hypothetical protein